MTSEDRRAIRIGAALFHADHGRLAEEVARLEKSGVDFIHLDVFDGYFVSDVGFCPRTIAAIRQRTRLPLEVHLGAREPLRFIPALAEAGVDLVFVHLECTPMPYETLRAIADRGPKAGIALSMGSPISCLEPLVAALGGCLIVCRATGEGAAGAGFDRAALRRIRSARQILAAAGSPADLQAAGGVNQGNVAEVVAAGAGSLALGSSLYRAPDMALQVAAIRSAAAGSE